MRCYTKTILGPGSALGEKEEKTSAGDMNRATLFFAFFPHYKAWSQAIPRLVLFYLLLMGLLRFKNYIC